MHSIIDANEWRGRKAFAKWNIANVMRLQANTLGEIVASWGNVTVHDPQQPELLDLWEF